MRDKIDKLAKSIVDNLKGGSDEHLRFPEMTEIIGDKIEQLIISYCEKQREVCGNEIVQQFETREKLGYSTVMSKELLFRVCEVAPLATKLPCTCKSEAAFDHCENSKCGKEKCKLK